MEGTSLEMERVTVDVEPYKCVPLISVLQDTASVPKHSLVSENRGYFSGNVPRFFKLPGKVGLVEKGL